MPSYILRSLPDDLWERVKERSQREGWHLRPLLLKLLEDYASGRIPVGSPPAKV